LSTAVLVGGIIMVVYYRQDDVHTNANGTITNVSKCHYDCNIGSLSGRYCVKVGDIEVRYQFDDDPGIWINSTIPPNDFCDSDCCLNYQVSNTTIYFLVEDDGTISRVSLIPDFNLHNLLAFGIVFIIIGICCFCACLMSTRKQNLFLSYQRI